MQKVNRRICYLRTNCKISEVRFHIKLAKLPVMQILGVEQFNNLMKWSCGISLRELRISLNHRARLRTIFHSCLDPHITYGTCCSAPSSEPMNAVEVHTFRCEVLVPATIIDRGTDIEWLAFTRTMLTLVIKALARWRGQRRKLSPAFVQHGPVSVAAWRLRWQCMRILEEYRRWTVKCGASSTTDLLEVKQAAYEHVESVVDV